MQRYISSELTHFVGKGLSEENQYLLLVKIISEGFLSHPPHSTSMSGNLFVNINAKLSTDEMYNPQVVCFCDIPYEDLSLHMDKYSRFGLAFDKKFIVSKGGSPVLYIPTTAKKTRSKTLSVTEIIERHQAGKEPVLREELEMGKYFDEMLQEYHALSLRNPDVLEEFGFRSFLDRHIFSFVKFFDPALADDDPNNFYFEREWRVFGNIHFKAEDVTRILLPHKFSKRFRADIPHYFGQISFSRAH
jgi:hypothetical protein